MALITGLSINTLKVNLHSLQFDYLTHFPPNIFLEVCLSSLHRAVLDPGIKTRNLSSFVIHFQMCVLCCSLSIQSQSFLVETANWLCIVNNLVAAAILWISLLVSLWKASINVTITWYLVFLGNINQLLFRCYWVVLALNWKQKKRDWNCVKTPRWITSHSFW